MSTKRHCYFLIAAATVAMLSPGNSTGVPVYVVQKSDDGWATEIDLPLDYEKCLSKSELLYEIVPESEVPQAVKRLKFSPAVRLSDTLAASILNLDRGDSKNSLATKILRTRIKDKKDYRDSVYATRKGSWSRADELDLAEMERLEKYGHGEELHAYLIRALTIRREDPKMEIRVRSCSRVVEVSHVSKSYEFSRPDRYAVIVFLKAKPRSVHVLTGFSTHGSDHE